MSLDYRKVRYFVAVYEEGSISRAAEREHVVQPAVSIQIKQLEAEFSARLFDRSSHGMEPTPAGDHFYKLCKRLIHDLDSARQQMLDLSGQIAGAVRFGVMPSICRGPLAPILMAYAAAYPRVEVTIVEATSGDLADAVMAGSLDGAICNQPASLPELRLRLLVRDPVMLVSGKATQFVPSRPCRLADLQNLKLVLPTVGNTIRRQLDAHMRRESVRPNRVMHIDGLGATLEFVDRSDWVTILPSIALQNNTDLGRFVTNPIVDPQVTSDIYEMHLPHRSLTKPAHELVRMIEAALTAPHHRTSDII
jgi:DNA-binding transcriptional LysR family regulator